MKSIPILLTRSTELFVTRNFVTLPFSVSASLGAGSQSLIVLPSISISESGVLTSEPKMPMPMAFLPLQRAMWHWLMVMWLPAPSTMMPPLSLGFSLSTSSRFSMRR